MDGWVKLHRRMEDHELWLGEPNTRGQLCCTEQFVAALGLVWREGAAFLKVLKNESKKDQKKTRE